MSSVYVIFVLCCVFFFYKQKTAYEMRISDWSSDVCSSDLFNCLSTIQYAVDVLKVRHIMIVGHYGCGGVGAALDDLRVGIADNWLRHVRDIAERHEERLKAIDDHQQRYDRLCELNVIEQVAHVCQTTIVEDAWQQGQTVIVQIG